MPEANASAAQHRKNSVFVGWAASRRKACGCPSLARRWVAEGQGGGAAADLRVLTGAALQAGESADSGYLEGPDTTKTVDSGLLLLRSRPGGRGGGARRYWLSHPRAPNVYAPQAAAMCASRTPPCRAGAPTWKMVRTGFSGSAWRRAPHDCRSASCRACRVILPGGHPVRHPQPALHRQHHCTGRKIAQQPRRQLQAACPDWPLWPPPPAVLPGSTRPPPPHPPTSCNSPRSVCRAARPSDVVGVWHL